MTEPYALLAVIVYFAGFIAVVAAACYIIKNCHIETDPVDSEHEWVDNRQGDSFHHSSLFDDDSNNSLFDNSSTDIFYNPTYSYLLCNIYHDSFHHD